MNDLRYAARVLLHNPGFAAAAAATLALAIGASTAIFSVAYGVSLRPLPYAAPDRLIRIYEANPAAGHLREDASAAAFHAWREGAASLESAALYTRPRTRFLAGDDERPVISMGVSPAFFDVLGVKPLAGPGFKRERDYTRFTARDVVLSFATSRRVFGDDPNVIGRPLRFADDQDAFRVVGVMPPDFRFIEAVDVWQPTIVEVPVARDIRGWRYDRVIGRLREGATIDQARAQLDVIAARLAQEFPTIHGGWTVTVVSLRDAIAGEFVRATWLLLATVVVVLVVASLNVGGLVVARAVARERETAVRIALGAGSWRLMRSWIAEVTLIAMVGAACGVLLAWAGVSALKAAAPPGIPRLEAIAVDRSALWFALVSTIGSVLMVALASIRGAPRAPLADRLRAGSPGAGGNPAHHAIRAALTAAQCAGAAALVIVSVMLTRSFIQLMSIDLGWNPSGVLSLTVSPPMPRELRRPWFRYVEWSDRLIAELRATPGITHAAITTQVPLSSDAFPSTIARGRGKSASDAARWTGVKHHVTDGYFDMLGIRLVEGRIFDARDRFAEPQINWTEKAERGVALVSATTARALWPGQSAIGQALWLPDVDNVTWREVVGVVQDVRFHEVGEPPALHVFLPWTQYSTGQPRLLVKSSGHAASIAAGVRDVVRRVEPGTKIDRVSSLDDLVSRATAQPRFTTRVVGTFGALALLLAAIGIYGTLSYLVAARTREIGIRLALGAPRSDVMAHVVWRGVAPAIAGGACGLAMAVALARTFRALLFDVQPVDSVSIAGGAALLIGVAVIAAVVPARRAARTNPLDALRTE